MLLSCRRLYYTGFVKASHNKVSSIIFRTSETSLDIACRAKEKITSTLSFKFYITIKFKENYSTTPLLDNLFEVVEHHNNFGIVKRFKQRKHVYYIEYYFHIYSFEITTYDDICVKNNSLISSFSFCLNSDYNLTEKFAYSPCSIYIKPFIPCSE